MQSKILPFWQRALTGEKITVTKKLGDQPLTKRYYEVNYNPIFDDKQNLIGACQAGRDVTQRMKLEAKLRKAKEEAELANKLKTQFFANISHEFRTPLTLMIGPLEDLLEEKAVQEQVAKLEQLKLIYRNALRLLRLVNSLLYFVRIEANRLEVIYEPTDLCQLTGDLVSVFALLLKDRG
jgi:signal transduction histidine kinase